LRREHNGQKKDRIEAEVRELGSAGFSPGEILSLFYLRAQWRARLVEECRPHGAGSQSNGE
jgi:hypothetical protein